MPLALLLFLSLAGCPALENPRPDGGDVPDAAVMPDAGDVLDAGDLPDAGEADAGLLLDLRLVRGAPYVTRVVSEHPGAEPFALSRTSYALALGCDGGACDYEVRSLDGGVLLARREGLAAVFGTSVSRDGRLASLVERPARSTCLQSDGSELTLWTGAWQLLELSTGEVRAQVPGLVTPAYADAAFLRSNHHARLMPVDPARCVGTPVLLRETRAPHAAPPVEPRLGDASFIEDELPDGRLINTRAVAGLQQVEVLDPFDPAADVVVTTDADEVRITAGFVHATTRFPAQQLTTYALETGRRVVTELPWTERDFVLHSASGRSVVFCDAARPVARCEVRDGLGERAPAVLQVDQVAGRLAVVLAGRADFVSWVQGGQVRRRSLVDGSEEVVLEVPARLKPVADGRAVLASTDAGFFAVDAARVHRFEGRPLSVVDAGGRAELRQGATVLVLTTSESGGQNWLHAWHVPSGRVARLSDAVLYNPPFQAPLVAAARCEVPGFVRAAGAPVDSAFVDAKLLHFTEFVATPEPRLRLFVMPVELDAPPRLVAEVTPDTCGTPLASADGSVVWLPVPMPSGGVRAVFAQP